jgi:hypothetical protein
MPGSGCSRRAACGCWCQPPRVRRRIPVRSWRCGPGRHQSGATTWIQPGRRCSPTPRRPCPLAIGPSSAPRPRQPIWYALDLEPGPEGLPRVLELTHPSLRAARPVPAREGRTAGGASRRARHSDGPAQRGALPGHVRVTARHTAGHGLSAAEKHGAHARAVPAAATGRLEEPVPVAVLGDDGVFCGGRVRRGLCVDARLALAQPGLWPVCPAGTVHRNGRHVHFGLRRKLDLAGPGRLAGTHFVRLGLPLGRSGPAAG